jgi:hypothetical protein
VLWRTALTAERPGGAVLGTTTMARIGQGEEGFMFTLPTTDSPFAACEEQAMELCEDNCLLTP